MQKKPLLIAFGLLCTIFVFFFALIVAVSSFSGRPTRLVPHTHIGVVKVEGMILDSTKIIEQLIAFHEDDGVKAIVLRVDSPGGGVGPSQEIYDEVRRIDADKPIVVSMGSVAASGGYYIAAPARRIFANPGTLRRRRPRRASSPRPRRSRSSRTRSSAARRNRGRARKKEGRQQLSGGAAPERVATYRRTVAASLARVWENVLDWEHLPWPHRDTFAAVRLETAGRDGWRAVVELRGGAEPLLIEVALDRAAHRYHTRTLDGPGAGTDIVTTLTPDGSHATGIEVAFLVPVVPPEAADAVGGVYRALYAKLWDEDEAMMVRRQAVLDGALAPGCREALIGGRSYRFVASCPHLGGPLEEAPVEDGCVTWPWHGYRFDVRTGQSTDGRGLRLRSA